jgi:small-conductance mechanosensitive channel
LLAGTKKETRNNMQEIFDYSILGNTVHAYLASLGILFGGATLLLIFKRYFLVRLKIWADSTDTMIDDLIVEAIEKTLVPILHFGILFASLHTLNLSPEFKHGLQIVAIIIITGFAVRALTAAVNHGLKSYLKLSHDDEGEKQIKGIRGLINIVIWILAVIFLLDNLGVKISAVVAGLGIGGIAVALASQAVLGDLFSYFVIFFDKPFQVGDTIAVGDKIGVVEQIGIKTTRLQAQSGEQLVISNTDLTNSRLHNLKKMEKRRV